MRTGTGKKIRGPTGPPPRSWATPLSPAILAPLSAACPTRVYGIPLPFPNTKGQTGQAGRTGMALVWPGRSQTTICL